MSSESGQEQPASAASPPTSTTNVYKNKSRVYTKTGDKGTSSLFNMTRRSKADDYFYALGDTDELNAHIGLVRAQCDAESESGRYGELPEHLAEIQSRLFDIGAHLATPRTSSNDAQKKRTEFCEHHVHTLEEWIDGMETELPPIRNFILPGGNLVSSHLHVARSVCRRAERQTVPLVNREDAEQVVQQYLNRLSDFLFVAARFVAHRAGCKETLWKKPREKRIKDNTQGTSETDEQ